MLTEVNMTQTEEQRKALEAVQRRWVRLVFGVLSEKRYARFRATVEKIRKSAEGRSTDNSTEARNE
jgi:DNA-binding MarR family transcriptional regulator